MPPGAAFIDDAAARLDGCLLALRRLVVLLGGTLAAHVGWQPANVFATPPAHVGIVSHLHGQAAGCHCATYTPYGRCDVLVRSWHVTRCRCADYITLMFAFN